MFASKLTPVVFLSLLLAPFAAGVPLEDLEARQSVDTSNHCGLFFVNLSETFLIFFRRLGCRNCGSLLPSA